MSSSGSNNEETNWCLVSEVSANREVRLSLTKAPVPDAVSLKANEVLVKVEAAPINPSDLGTLLARSDYTTLATASDGNGVTAQLSEEAFARAKSRVGQPVRCGNEGSGYVVAAGSAAKALMGKLVAFMPFEGCYAQYCVVDTSRCLEMHDGTTPEEAASCFVNPLTALGMVDTVSSQCTRCIQFRI